MADKDIFVEEDAKVFFFHAIHVCSSTLHFFKSLSGTVMTI